MGEAAREPDRPSVGREAMVTEVRGDRLVARVPDGETVEARVAVPRYDAQVGDRVLLLDAERDATFVVGVIATGRADLATVGATRVSVEGDTIVLRREDGALVLRHDAALGRTTVAPAAGDLILESPADVVLRAADAVRLEGREVTVDAGTILHRADSVRTEATSIHWSADRWELRVNRLREHASEAIRQIDGLLQTRAGRLRTVVRESAHYVAKRTLLRSEETTAIDGRKVHLG